MVEIDELPPAELTLARATWSDADEMAAVIRAAFGARPALDPPAPALSETPASVRELLERGGAVVARWGAEMAGVIVLSWSDRTAVLQRVSVHPRFQRLGIASAMVAVVEPYAVELGCVRVELVARAVFPELIQFWQHLGFAVAPPRSGGVPDYLVTLTKELPVVLMADTAEQMKALGARLAGLLRAGDLVIAHGDLGAGKTTFTQGLAQALEVEGPVISPTFVLSRVHPARTGQPALVHVDAYRLGGPAELDDLGLELDQSVTVVEWGVGIAEQLSEDRLLVSIHRAQAEPAELAERDFGEPADDPRTVMIIGTGDRWDRAEIARVMHG